MTMQSEKTLQPKVSVKWALIGGCIAVALLFVIGCIYTWFLMSRNGNEPITASMVERITRQFVQALHEGEVSAAHQMFSDKIRSGISDDDILRLVGGDENRLIFSTYQSLDVCDWGFFAIDGERVVSAKGLLHYQSGIVVFESDLRKDSDGLWRIYGFWLKREIDPKPFGRCH